MAKILLLNPGKRKARRAAPKRARKARRAPAKRSASRSVVMVANPRRRARRPNPIFTKRTRRARRRNPIALGGKGFYVSMFKDALIGGAGSVAVDMAMRQIDGFLPASLQSTPNAVDAHDAIRAVFTVAAGKLLNKATRGVSVKAARGALTVQMAGLLNNALPASLTGLGFYSPSPVIQGTNRVGPIRSGVNAYTQPGKTALLSAYAQPGGSPLLSGFNEQSARAREGASNWR